eukprot:m.882933 g.882933  ORF g.882933 m.882933 type:complete len:1554 (-) comp23600_c0_seq2:423-5084(-)
MKTVSHGIASATLLASASLLFITHPSSGQTTPGCTDPNPSFSYSSWSSWTPLCGAGARSRARHCSAGCGCSAPVVPTMETRTQTEDNPAPLGSTVTTVDSITGLQRVVSCEDLVLYCNPVLGLPAVANQCPVTCLRCSRDTLPPFAAPTTSPSITPTLQPTATPSNAPTDAPSEMPTSSAPTFAPTNVPSDSPTASPQPAPVGPPTNMPTASPTGCSIRTVQDCPQDHFLELPCLVDQNGQCAECANVTCDHLDLLPASSGAIESAAQFFGRSGTCDASTGGYSCEPCPSCPVGFYRNASCVVAVDGATQGCLRCSTSKSCVGGVLLGTCQGDHDFSCGVCEPHQFYVAGSFRCDNISDCVILNETYEVLAPASDRDRVCANVSGSCGQFQYLSTPATATSDRICTECDPCSGSQTRVEACSAADPAAGCVDCVTACPIGAELQGTCTSTTAPQCVPCNTTASFFNMTTRVCQALHDCALGEFESVAPTVSTDRTCQMTTPCAVDTHEECEEAPPTATTDRMCGNITRCANVVQPRADVVSACRNATTPLACNASGDCHWVGSTCYDAGDTTGVLCRDLLAPSPCRRVGYCVWGPDSICAAAVDARAALSYVASAHTPTSDRVCVRTSRCLAGTFASLAPTPTSDRSCSPCDDDTFQPEDDFVGDECTPRALCDAGEYADARVYNASTDRTCLPCAQGTYQNATAHALPVCTPVRGCSAGSYVIVNATAIADVVCLSCPHGRFQEQDGFLGSACPQAWRSCDHGEYLENVSATPSTDRVCLPCPPQTYQNETDFEGTSCTSWSRVCVDGTEFTSEPGTNVSDQTTCSPCTTCVEEDVDMVFAIDVSEDTTLSDWQASLDFVSQYAWGALNAASVNDSVHIAVIAFSDVATVVVPIQSLADPQLLEDLSVARSNATYSGVFGGSRVITAAIGAVEQCVTRTSGCLPTNGDGSGDGEDGSGDAVDDDVGSGGSGDGGVAAGGVARDARRMAVFVARGGTPTLSDAEIDAALAGVPVYSTFERRVFAVGVTAPADLIQLLTVVASDVRLGQVVSVASALSVHTDALVSALCVRGCGWGAYESSRCTVVGDRICSSLTPCTPHTQFERTPSTLSSDRVCQALTVCTEDEFALQQPTTTSDRVCTLTTRCYPGEFEHTPATQTTDRVCMELSFCNTSEVEAAAPTPTSDRVCRAISNVSTTRPFTTAGLFPVTTQSSTASESTHQELTSPSTTASLAVTSPLLELMFSPRLALHTSAEVAMSTVSGGMVLDTFALPAGDTRVEHDLFLACAARCMTHGTADVVCTGVLLDTPTATCSLLGTLTPLFGSGEMVGSAGTNDTSAFGEGVGLYVRQGMHPDGVVYDRDGAWQTAQTAHTTLDLVASARNHSTGTTTTSDALVFDGTGGVSFPFHTVIPGSDPITFDFQVSIDASTSGYVFALTDVTGMVRYQSLYYSQRFSRMTYYYVTYERGLSSIHFDDGVASALRASEVGDMHRLILQISRNGVVALTIDDSYHSKRRVASDVVRACSPGASTVVSTYLCARRTRSQLYSSALVNYSL